MRWLGIAVVAAATAITGALSAAWGEFTGPDNPVDVGAPRGGPTHSVVLVTLDGVRAREIFLGADPDLAGRSGLPGWARGDAERLLPNIHRLFMEGGAALGDPRLKRGISASGPKYYSLPGYLEIMTGAPATCRSNQCIPTPLETLADAFVDAGESAAVYGSWEIIARAATGSVRSDARTADVHAGREASETMAPYPGNGMYRPDSATWQRAMAAITAGRPSFLWIALGDTDEWAHRHDYIGYLGALRVADRALGELASRIAEEDESGTPGGGTMLIVTTDHGRDPGFADHGEDTTSAPVWMLARGPAIAVRGSIEPTRQRYLRDIAPTVRAVLGLPPPTLEGSGEVIDEILRPERRAISQALNRTARATSSN